MQYSKSTGPKLCIMLYRWGLFLIVSAFVMTGCSDLMVNELTIDESNSVAVEEALENRSRAAGQQNLTVVETALAVNAETGEFSTLIAALVAADLVGAVDAYGQVTVFAPTDDAFAALGLTADNVGDLDVEFLTNVLLYHLKTGRQFSKPVLNKKQIKMENGGFIYPDASVPGVVDANGGVAPIVIADVAASNGVIHAIGSVLIP